VIPVAELDVPDSNRELAVWYQPMSVAVFDAIMDRLDIEFPQFTFVDFGSGMGRVLLLASEYGFAEVIGVEFSRQLHDIALHNADIYTAASAQRSPIRAICMDATEFELPEGPLVLFFFSPFMGRVLEQVIQNVERSFAAERRPIVLVYHGANTESISAFQASSFAGREMHLNLGWFTPVKYRTFVFTNGFAADAEA
jgi:SAM-dependent methyltransferase